MAPSAHAVACVGHARMPELQRLEAAPGRVEQALVGAEPAAVETMPRRTGGHRRGVRAVVMRAAAARLPAPSFCAWHRPEAPAAVKRQTEAATSPSETSSVSCDAPHRRCRGDSRLGGARAVGRATARRAGRPRPGWRRRTESRSISAAILLNPVSVVSVSSATRRRRRRDPALQFVRLSQRASYQAAVCTRRTAVAQPDTENPSSPSTPPLLRPQANARDQPRSPLRESVRRSCRRPPPARATSRPFTRTSTGSSGGRPRSMTDPGRGASGRRASSRSRRTGRSAAGRCRG